MAEETVNSQTVDKTATPASVEPEIESLLPNIPDLADLFAGTPTTQETGKAPEQPKDGATKKEPVTPETADKEQHLEDLIPAGLKPEEDKPPEEPKKEEIPPPDKFQQRIDELTAKRKSAEEKATALETELFELKAKAQAPPPLAPTPSNPLSDVMTEADLQKRI